MFVRVVGLFVRVVVAKKILLTAFLFKILLIAFLFLILLGLGLWTETWSQLVNKMTRVPQGTLWDLFTVSQGLLEVS